MINEASRKQTKKPAGISFNPKQAVKRLLSAIPPRAQDIISGRFGLNGEKKMTLEAIGKKYGITRERVRQIENYSISSIRRSSAYGKEKENFDELKLLLKKLGGIVTEHELLEHISKDKSVQNNVHFMLIIGEDFSKEKEDEEFRHRWHIDKSLSDRIHEAIRKLYESLKDDEIVPESELVKAFLNHLKDVSEEYKDDEIIARWLRISKNIGKNPLGDWGKAKSSNISARGIRDYAYLVIRRHGSPIHFREVARLISEIFNKKAHVATTHNELIKDSRFVLVGRGLYALKEWGYSQGIVRDVIADILKKNGPLPRDKVIDKVLKERYVKENTILVNLQNPKFFKKSKDGLYALASQ